MIILSENMPVFSMSFKFHLNEYFMGLPDTSGYVKNTIANIPGSLGLEDSQFEIFFFSILLFSYWEKKNGVLQQFSYFSVSPQ